jgi:hypothetical protein
MADNDKKQMPQIPEGDLFLLVRIDPRTQDFQCVFSDLISALALHKLAQEFIEQNFTRKMFAAAPQIQAAPSSFRPGMISQFSKGKS